MKLIVGLGNPGSNYEQTRHNVGFRVIDCLAERWGFDLRTEKFHGWVASGSIVGVSAALMKPSTFMNLSGRAVIAAGRFYRLELSDLMVILDDLALECGRLRMRRSGTAGGHKGLGDIINRIGSDEFCRLRIGIGQAIGRPTDYVLGRFTPDEEAAANLAVKHAADAVEHWLAHGVESAMNAFNAPTGGDA